MTDDRKSVATSTDPQPQTREELFDLFVDFLHANFPDEWERFLSLSLDGYEEKKTVEQQEHDAAMRDAALDLSDNPDIPF